MKPILTLIIPLIAFSTFTTVAMAKATLRIPVQFEADHGATPAREINEKLKKVGAPLVPEFIEISTGEKAYEKFAALDAQIAESVKALGEEGENLLRSSERYPGSNDKKDLKTCYLGKPSDAVNIAASLADVAYSLPRLLTTTTTSENL